MATGGGYNAPFNKVKLYLSCTELKCRCPCPSSSRGSCQHEHYFSSNSPFAVLYESKVTADHQGTSWTKIGRTEAAVDCIEPKFRVSIMVNHHVEEVQHFKVAIHEYNERFEMDDLEKHRLLGEAQFKLVDVVTVETVLTRQLMKLGGSEKVGEGFVHITTEETQESKFDIVMFVYVENLPRKTFFKKPIYAHPFVEVAKQQKDGSFTTVQNTKPKMTKEEGFLESGWFVRIPMENSEFCDGDWDRTLQFSVFNWNKKGTNEVIGNATCTIHEITPEMGTTRWLNLIKAKKGHKYQNSGTMGFFFVQSKTLFSFMDYIKGGCQFNLTVAIDFTGSNGKPSDPASLHYNDPHKDNDYVSAIKSMAAILADYDSDQKFPVFGFGARAHQFQGVSHCFPLNFNFNAPEVVGVQGILDSYHYALGQLQFDEPTILSLILDKAIEVAEQSSTTGDKWCYQVLLIITDGVITDMYDVIDRIVKASSLPLSIIIVGVGNADFSAMEVLNAKGNPLKDRHGTEAERNIVQFVPYKGISIKEYFSFVKEVLAHQFLSYTKDRSIEPSDTVSKGATTAD